MLKFVNKKHDAIVKFRNALIIYLVFIGLFRLTMWLGVVYTTEETYPAFTLYSSFFLVAVGGLVLALYFHGGGIKLPSLKSNKSVRDAKRKLNDARKIVEEEKKALRKQQEEMKAVLKRSQEEVSKKRSGRKKSIKGFSKIPDLKHQRIEMFRSIAGQIQSEKASFTVSGIMESMVQHFPAKVDEDRKAFLKEIEEWVGEDPYTPLLKVENGVKLYRMLTK